MLMAVGLRPNDKINKEDTKPAAAPSIIEKAVIDDGSTTMA